MECVREGFLNINELCTGQRPPHEDKDMSRLCVPRLRKLAILADADRGETEPSQLSRSLYKVCTVLFACHGIRKSSYAITLPCHMPFLPHWSLHMPHHHVSPMLLAALISDLTSISLGHESPRHHYLAI